MVKRTTTRIGVAVIALSISLVGCNRSAPPTTDSSATDSSATVTTKPDKPDWKLVTLHIDGFKKSKSGGT